MEIPLFPLPNLVLFPQVVLPLHIFEDRYKLMINRCIDGEQAFGVVLLRENAQQESEETIHRAGVTARVVQVERLEEGRMNILTAGESRFRIIEFTGANPYWTASVTPFEDDPEPDDMLEEAYREVVERYRRVFELTAKLRAVEPAEPTLPQSPLALSFMVSYVLNIDPEKKQELLELTSTFRRLNTLIPYLDETASELQLQIMRRDVAAKARGNGDLGRPGTRREE